MLDQQDGATAKGKMRARRMRSPQRAIYPTAGSDNKRPPVLTDPYRSVVFPNRIREQRIRHGHTRLFAFASLIQEVPYIRLSKIERGEVFARVDEIVRIANIIQVDPAELLLDVDAPDFNIANWFLPFADGTAADSRAEAEFAMLLAAAVRAKRGTDGLSASTMEGDYGIPPVILSRIENAQKGLARWNDQTVANICKLFAAASEAELRDHVTAMYDAGELTSFLEGIAGADQRVARSHQRIAALRMELEHVQNGSISARQLLNANPKDDRSIPVFGAPLSDGLIAMTPTDTSIEKPSIAGSRAYGLRVGRSTLGGGLPGQAIVVVDPDRFPQAGGLAVVREDGGYRILAVVLERDGQMMGYSVSPPLEMPIGTLAPTDVAAIVSAQFMG